MKKPFIIAAAAFICAGIFLQEAKAQEAVYNEDTVADNVARIGILMKDLDANKAGIQKLALEIPYHERAALYKKGKTDALPSVALNAFSFFIGIPPNLGIGSFVQHDTAGGLINLGTGLAGLGCIGAGFGTLLISKNPDTAAALFVSGGALCLGSWIFGIVRPIVFASSHNKKLEDALLLKTQVTVVPAVGADRLGLGVAIRY
jgi:hypothetical protein